MVNDADDRDQLAAALLVELRAMTEEEQSEPNNYRWVAPPADSRSVAHVACVSGDVWGTFCDCTVPRRSFTDRVRGGLLICPSCLSNVVYQCQRNNLESMVLGRHLLRQIGYKEEDPLPVIHRIQEREHGWVKRQAARIAT
jgi:hypothetical protein